MKKLKPCIFLVFCILIDITTTGQEQYEEKLIQLPVKVLNQLKEKAILIENKLECQTRKYLSKIEKAEKKLKKNLQKKDSLLARQIFLENKGNEIEKHAGFNAIGHPGKVYSGHLDSLSTAIKFLKFSFPGNLLLSKNYHIDTYYCSNSWMQVNSSKNSYCKNRNYLFRLVKVPD